MDKSRRKILLTHPPNQAAAEGLGAEGLISDLRALKLDVRYANYCDGLLERTEALEKSLKLLEQSDQLSFSVALCTIAEVYDYYGLYRRGFELIQTLALSIRANLISFQRPTADNERKLTRQKVWLLVHFAHGIYRRHEYQLSLAVLNDCESTVERVLLDADHFNSSTLARIAFNRSQCLRQLNRFEEATREIGRALKHSSTSLEERKRKLLDVRARTPAAQDVGDGDRYMQEEALAKHRVAMILSTGLGWLSYTQGLIDSADALIASARLLFVSSNDWLHKAYANLLYGCLQRSKAGLDLTQLQDAIRTIEAAYKTFHDRKHVYQARAAYELALAHTYSGNFDVARRFIDEVATMATKSGDVRWEANALVVLSRIERRSGSPKAAADFAQLAYERSTGDGSDLTACSIDALIAQGEARFDLQDYERAIGDFTKAAQWGEGNLKDQGSLLPALGENASSEKSV